MKNKIIFGVVFNAIVALGMCITADLLNGGLSSRTILMYLVGFTCAFILSLVIDSPKLSATFAKLFKLDPKSLAGQLVGGILPAFVNTIVICLVMLIINVNPFEIGFVPFVFAYLSMLWKLTIVAYVLSFPANIIAGKAVQKANQ